VLELAERGDRLYCLRMVRDIEGSENLMKAETFEVDGNRIRIPTSPIKATKLDNYQKSG